MSGSTSSGIGSLAGRCLAAMYKTLSGVLPFLSEV
jgi:hypothetical protein